MRFRPPQANASGGYTMISINFLLSHIPKTQKEETQVPISLAVTSSLSTRRSQPAQKTDETTDGPSTLKRSG